MRTVHRGVHAHRPVDRVRSTRIAQQAGMDPIPSAITRVGAVTLPQRLPRPELVWHVPPRRPRPEPEDDAFHDPPIIPERAAPPSHRGRRQRLNPHPLSIRQNNRPRHESSIPHTTHPFRRHTLVVTELGRRHESWLVLLPNRYRSRSPGDTVAWACPGLSPSLVWLVQSVGSGQECHRFIGRRPKYRTIRATLPVRSTRRITGEKTANNTVINPVKIVPTGALKQSPPPPNREHGRVERFLNHRHVPAPVHRENHDRVCSDPASRWGLLRRWQSQPQSPRAHW